MEDVRLERRNCFQSLELKEIGVWFPHIVLHSSFNTQLFAVSWCFYFLYPVFTVGGYDKVSCYYEGHFRLLREGKVEGEGRKGEKRKGLSILLLQSDLDSPLAKALSSQ